MKIEELLKAISICVNDDPCGGCPYYLKLVKRGMSCENVLLLDAVEVIKAQEELIDALRKQCDKRTKE